MSNLILVRHGQASFLSDDYDQLSALGETQSGLLGTYWAERAVSFDAVYVGPLRRHRQTYELVLSAYQQVTQPAWSAAQEIADLEEHQGMYIFEALLSDLAQQPGRLGQLAASVVSGQATRRERLGAYLLFTQRWAAGEIDSGPYEPWSVFCGRVQRGLTTIMDQEGRNKRIVAFTSGGVIAAAVGFALDVNPVKTIELNGMANNGGYAEFRFSRQEKQLRFSLSKFNATPHLETDDLLTYI